MPKPITILGLLLGIALTLLLSQGVSAEPRPCSTPSVHTSSGPVCGRRIPVFDREVRVFLGIPFGESTAGAGRWSPPRLRRTSSQKIPATRYGPICPQNPEQAPGLEQSEDCLNLNIWAPIPKKTSKADSSLLPVMVFIYGGSFLGGSNLVPVYHGENLAARGKVVVVEINYRLGALGFMSGWEGLEGNYGFLDQQLALRWVRDNIENFGGDPKQVTLFGQSAGAMSVGLHLISPSSQGLFRAAIMESNPYGIPYKTDSQGKKFAKILRDAVGCKSEGLTCMRDATRVTARQLVRHQASGKLMLQGALEGISGQLVWAPVVDGSLIPGQPNAKPLNKPVLMGTNRNEGVIFAVEQQVKLPLEKKRQLPKLLYEMVLLTYFPMDRVFNILGISRYRSQGGDNTEALSHLITDYLFTCPNRRVMQRSRNKVFAYQFNHVPSFNVWPKIKLCAPDHQKVCHAAELPFVFGNPVAVVIPPRPKQYRYEFQPGEKNLADQMIRYWSQFAYSGDPNAEGLPHWPPFSDSNPKRLLFEKNISETDQWKAPCDFWDSVGYDLRGLIKRML